MEAMTKHSLSYGQGGDIRVLHRVCASYGWNWQSVVIKGEKFEKINVFINRQPDEIVLELIATHEGVYGFLEHPTPEMKRLQEIKWKL